MARRRGSAGGALPLTLTVTLAAGGGCIRLVWEYADGYAYLPMPPLAAPFWLLALCYGLLWPLLGVAAGMALSAPVHPLDRSGMAQRYLCCLGLSLLLPLCLLRWDLPLIAFALAALLLPLTGMLVSAFASANRLAGLLLLPHLLFATYQVYLLLGISLLA